MATIKEIARACGVSIATVSNVLNDKPGAGEETRRLVLEKVKELNYTPNTAARDLKTKKSRSIGIVVEDMTIFCTPDIVDGITEYCEKEKYHILLSNLRLYKKHRESYFYRDDYYGKVREAIWDLQAKQAAGIIYVAAHERTIRCIPEDLPIPAVMAYSYTGDQDIPSVVVDDRIGALLGVQHIIDRGHRRIAVITGDQNSMHTKDRLVGYQQALFNNGVLYDPGLVYPGDWSRESGYRWTDDLLRQKVTAVFCMNDLAAGGVYDRLTELQLKPGVDLAVIGYDDREVAAYYNPPLTTVALPLHDIGYTAGRLIFKMLRGDELKESDRIRMVSGEVILRDSVNLASTSCV